MIPIYKKPQGRFYGLEKSWNYLLSTISKKAAEGKQVKVLPKKKFLGVSIAEDLGYLVKAVELAPAYESLPYIPSGSRENILLAFKKVKQRKKDVVAQLGSTSHYLPSIMYGIAMNYVMAIDEAGRLLFARSPLGDLLIKHCDLTHKKMNLKTVLTYFFGGLLAPSYTSVLYLLMNSLQTYDTETIARVLKNKLLVGTAKYWRLYMSLFLEIVDTWYLGKYKRVGVKEVYITPSHSAYRLAKMADMLIDFDTYRKLYVYISKRKGLATEDGFKHLFEGVIVDEAEIEKLLSTHPFLSNITMLVDKLRDQYEWLDNEVTRLLSA